MKKQYKIFGLILALALLVGATFAVASFSASAADSLAIEYANVAYNKMTQLAFTIKGTPAQGATIGLAYWDFNVTGEKTLDNATVTFEAGTLQGKTYWLTPGIPASEMSEKITVAPVTRDANNNVALAGALFEYSIYDYVKDRLADNNVTDSQMKLYTNLVKYGNAAEKRINGTINTPYFVAENGEINNTGKGLALANEGDKLLLRAKTINADGDYFLYWTAPDGSKIYDRVAAVTAGTANTTYKANYGAKADSAYAIGHNYNNYDTGVLNTVTTGAINQKGDYYYVSGESSHLGRLVTVKALAQVTSAEDRTVISHDRLAIDTENGSNYLSFDKIVTNKIANGTDQFIKLYNPASTKAENRVEIDLRFPEKVWTGVNVCLYTTKGEKFPTVVVESDGRLSINGVSAGKYARGEMINIVVDITDAGFVFYVNGDYVTTYSQTAFAGAYFNCIGFQSHGGSSMVMDFFAVNFINTENFN